MRTLLKLLIVLVILAGIGTGIYFPAANYLAERNRPKFRYKEVIEGPLTLHVNATGTVEPVMRVNVGAVVSGPIAELKVDFNDRVEKGQLMARIDPRLFESVVLRDRALLETRRAEVERAEARLQQAINAEERAEKLIKQSARLISDAALDDARFSRLAAAADLSVAKTAVQQAQANLDNSEANLEYTEIRSPVEGVVIDRKVDEGQSLAAQFQTPEMFIVAPQMEEKMHIYASVDEADIGLIRQAQEEERPVTFTVDAYPNTVFKEAKIREVRLSSSEEQNVVTYPVVVETPNQDQKLLPGMTANLSFQVQHFDKVTKIPNAALRFYPPNRAWVHPDDRPILDGVELTKADAERENQEERSAEERAEISRNRSRRHVWVYTENFLRAKEVFVESSDSRYTRLLNGDVKPGDSLVIGEQPKES